MVGNKCDMEASREVSTRQGQELASELGNTVTLPQTHTHTLYVVTPTPTPLVYRTSVLGGRLTLIPFLFMNIRKTRGLNAFL